MHKARVIRFRADTARPALRIAAACARRGAASRMAPTAAGAWHGG